MTVSPHTCLTLGDAEQFVFGECDPRSSRNIEAHLKSCHTCRDLIEDVSRNLEFADDLKRRVHRPHSDDPARADTHLGQRLGPFQIERELGRGGMSVVYLARQSNPPRPVALKVLSMSQALDRHHAHLLEREGRVLAMLRHPNLAAIYEAGQTADGRPYLSMELVNGTPLLVHAGDRDLSVVQRLELFLPVCDAVAHAHQRGVIHRDLKPSNILVEPDGQPKVLDFGLARLLETDDGDALPGSVVSEVGSICGTIPYMSPEQIRGDRDAIDVRTDVYALGVVLYELLTGSLPYPVDRANIPAAARTICETPPQPPGSMKPALRGDLETIVLKALAKDPARRYATVPAFSDDVRRFLRNEPIAARPATFGYQLRKLVIRHKAPFAIAAASFVVLAGLIAALAVLAIRLERQRGTALAAQMNESASREEAERQASIAGAVNTFLTDMLAAANPESDGDARERKVVDVLDEAARLLGTAFADEPEVEASLRFTLGNSYRALGRLEAAEEQLSRALEIRRRAFPGDSDATAQNVNKLARTQQDLGRYDEAEALYREMLEMHLRLHGEAHGETAKARNNLGWMLCLRGDNEGAEAQLRQALAIQRELFGQRSTEVASTLNNLAIALMRSGRREEALPMFQQSLGIDREILGEDHLHVAITTMNVAVLLSEIGRLDEARAEMPAAIEHLRRLLGEEHIRIATAFRLFADLLMKSGDVEAAEERYRHALEVALRSGGPDHPEVAATMESLARMHIAQADPAAAETCYRESLRVRRLKFPPGHRDTIACAIALAETLHVLGRDDEAKEILSHAIGTRDGSNPPDESLVQRAARLRDSLMPGGDAKR